MLESMKAPPDESNLTCDPTLTRSFVFAKYLLTIQRWLVGGVENILGIARLGCKPKEGLPGDPRMREEFSWSSKHAPS